MGIFHCHVSLPEGSFLEGRSQPLLFQVFCFFSHYEDSTEMLEVQTPDERVVADETTRLTPTTAGLPCCFSFLLLKVFVVKCKGKRENRNGKHLGLVIRYNVYPQAMCYDLRLLKACESLELACRQVYRRSFSHLGGKDIYDRCQLHHGIYSDSKLEPSTKYRLMMMMMMMMIMMYTVYTCLHVCTQITVTWTAFQGLRPYTSILSCLVNSKVSSGTLLGETVMFLPLNTTVFCMFCYEWRTLSRP